jgi:hypothetical protein
LVVARFEAAGRPLMFNSGIPFLGTYSLSPAKC